MMTFFYFHANGFDWEENYWDLKILYLNQLNKYPRPFDGISKDYSCWYWYLWWWTEHFLKQIVQISVIFISYISIIMKIQKWYPVSLTPNISAKTWPNCTCRGCFENIRTCRFQICPWFWKLANICGMGVIEQNKISNFFCQYCISLHYFNPITNLSLYSKSCWQRRRPGSISRSSS